MTLICKYSKLIQNDVVTSPITIFVSKCEYTINVSKMCQRVQYYIMYITQLRVDTEIFSLSDFICGLKKDRMLLRTAGENWLLGAGVLKK